MPGAGIRSGDLLVVETETPHSKLKGSGIVFRSSNYELYGDMSGRIAAALGTFTPEVERYSIAEAFLHFGGAETPGGWGTIGRAVRERVLRWTGIP